MPQLDVGAAIGYGWKKFTDNVGPFIILMLVVFAAFVLVSLVQTFLTPDSTGFMAIIWSAVLALVAYVITSIVQAGVLRAGLAVTRGEEPSVDHLTKTDNIANYILTVILVGIGFFVGFVLCIIPGIIWLIFTAYAPIVAIDKGVGPVEAIQQSINWVKNDFGRVFVILLVAYIVYIAGACLCGVGLLVSVPVGLMAMIYSYKALNNEPVVT